MPRPCAVEVHARGYTKAGKFSPGCHGLAPWRFTLAATQKLENSLRDATALRRGGSCSRLHKSWKILSGMSRPCAVEVHARGYTKAGEHSPDATALRRGGSRSRLHKTPQIWRVGRPWGVRFPL